MKVSRNWLQMFFDKPLPQAGALSHLFTFHSFEVEGIEKRGDDDILDVKVLPDRAHYALSHKGIAEEVSVLTKMPLKADRIPPLPEASLAVAPKVKIEAPDFCRRYMARYAEIGAVKPSNPHAKAMLESIGQRAIDAVVDSTNITMFDCGQPMHIFDADKVKGAIVVRAAKKGEKIMLLDFSAGTDREVELRDTDHVIADDDGPIAIAGVKGGKSTAVTGSTKKLLIESANFAPEAVRRTATRLNLRSESSKRYENEITPELASEGMASVCGLLKHDMPEAKFGPIVDEYPHKAKQSKIELDPSYIAERLGIEVPEAEMRSILAALRIAIEEKGGKWHLTVPFERLDLTIKEDIVEEIGRIYGYEHVKGVLPPKPAREPQVLPGFYVAEALKNELVARGFSEVSLYSLVSKGEIETAYPLARDKAFARLNLSDGMLSCVEKNALNADLLGLGAIKIFEIGNVFSLKGETVSLCLGGAQVKKIKGLKFDEFLKTMLMEAFAKFGLPTVATKVSSKGTCFAVEADLSAALKGFKLPETASYQDLQFSRASESRFTRFSSYPFIVRDIAVFVPDSAAPDAVWAEIQKGIGQAEDLLVRHALFDTFKKDGKISYAFRMVFQAGDRTLTDEEANKIMESVYSAVKARGWEVR